MTLYSGIQPLEQFVGTINHILGEKFTKVLGQEWKRFTNRDGTTELRLLSLIPKHNQEVVKWYTQKLTGRVKEFKFSRLPDGKIQLTIPLPSTDNGHAARETMQPCQFPHLSLKILNISLRDRVGVRVLLVGPKMIRLKQNGGTLPPNSKGVYCPQMAELALYFPKAKITVMDTALCVLETIEELRKRKLRYKLNIPRQTLLEEYRRKVSKMITKPHIFESFITLLGDIARKPLKRSFDFIVATTALRAIPHQYGVETIEEGKKLALRTLGHLFSALSSRGRLYIDKESIDLFIAISGMNSDLFFEELRENLQVDAIAHEEIPSTDSRYASAEQSIGTCAGTIFEYTLVNSSSRPNSPRNKENEVWANRCRSM